MDEFVFLLVFSEEGDEVGVAILLGVEGVLELYGGVGEEDEGFEVVDGGDFVVFDGLPVGFYHALDGALLLETEVLSDVDGF
jgi:hypothetical protein